MRASPGPMPAPNTPPGPWAKRGGRDSGWKPHSPVETPSRNHRSFPALCAGQKGGCAVVRGRHRKHQLAPSPAQKGRWARADEAAAPASSSGGSRLSVSKAGLTRQFTVKFFSFNLDVQCLQKFKKLKYTSHVNPPLSSQKQVWARLRGAPITALPAPSAGGMVGTVGTGRDSAA